MMDVDRQVALAQYWSKRADRELLREKNDPNKLIHTDMILQMIKRSLPRQNCTVLDVGGGTGRFSIPLSELGCSVTHVDISDEMLRIAREKARECGIGKLTFSKASVTDLSAYPDRSFEVVICLDAPVSSCHAAYPLALNELARVADRKLVLTVFNRTGVILGAAVDFDINHFGKLKTVWDVFRTGNLEVTDELLKLRPTLMPSWHAFTPKEIVDELENRYFRCTEMSAPGTLSRFVPKELLERIINPIVA